MVAVATGCWLLCNARVDPHLSAGCIPTHMHALRTPMHTMLVRAHHHSCLDPPHWPAYAHNLRVLTSHLQLEAVEILPNGAPCNKTITSMMEGMKKEILEMIDYLDVLKMWIQLNIPAIQDQKVLGVTVKEEIAEMLQGGKHSGLAVCDNMTKYFATRGKLVSKVLKYPGAQDYLTAVQELDDKEHVLLDSMCLDLRNNYAIIYDMIIKNFDKICKQTREEVYKRMY